MAFLVIHTAWVILLYLSFQNSLVYTDKAALAGWMAQFWIDFPISLIYAYLPNYVLQLIEFADPSTDTLTWGIGYNYSIAVNALIFGGFQYYLIGYLFDWWLFERKNGLHRANTDTQK